MPGQLRKFQMVGFQSWQGLTKENHLGQIFQLAPQKASNLMVQLLALHRGKTYETFLSKFPVREFSDDSEYTWDAIGSSRRNIPLIEARDENGTPITAASGMVGAGFAPFYLVFGEDWFGHNEVIWGNLNEAYPIRIKSDAARFEGTNAVYCVECFGTNSKGIPAERLLAGERFSPAYAAVEKDLSRKAGTVRYASPVSMRNEWTTIRIQNKVGGNMLDKKLAVGIPVTKETAGLKLEHTVVTQWMHYEDWVTEQQFSEYKNNAILWGVSTRNNNGEYYNFGDSGEAIRAGDGLFEQMKMGGNVIYYNDTDNILKLLEDALYELSASKLDFNDRRFLVVTGERGALLFNKAAKRTTSGWMPLLSTQNPAYYSRRNTNYAPDNGLSVTDYQVTEWKAPNGLVIELQVDAMYDDVVRNKVLSPLGGVAFSYRFDIFYMGTMDQPNIFKCAIKNQNEFRGYQWGLRNPFTGKIGNEFMSFDEDAAVFHRMAKFGVCVLDPTRTMSLIPAILQG